MNKMQVKEVTVEYLKSRYSHYQDVREFLEALNPRPPKVNKPRLSVAHTSDEAKQYAEDLANYESDQKKYFNFKQTS